MKKAHTHLTQLIRISLLSLMLSLTGFTSLTHSQTVTAQESDPAFRVQACVTLDTDQFRFLFTDFTASGNYRLRGDSGTIFLQNGVTPGDSFGGFTNANTSLVTFEETTWHLEFDYSGSWGGAGGSFVTDVAEFHLDENFCPPDPTPSPSPSVTPSSSPSPSPQSSPNPEAGKHSSLGYNVTCTSDQFDVDYDLKENGNPVADVEVEFDYNGQQQKVKTNQDGRARAHFTYTASHAVTAKAGGFPTQSIHVVMKNCDATTEVPSTADSDISGATRLADTSSFKTRIFGYFAGFIFGMITV